MNNIGPHRAHMGPIGPQGPHEGGGRPPWALWGPKGPMRGGGAPHGPYGPKGPRGGYGEAAPGRESPRAESGPAATPSLGRIFASAPKSESDPELLVEKKSQDLANLDPPRAPEGLPRHFGQIPRGQKLCTFDELWPIEIFPAKKVGKTSFGLFWTLPTLYGHPLGSVWGGA